MIGLIPAPMHTREAERLAALERYAVLDTPREAAFDDLAALASEICETPIAAVNLIAEGRQWFKAEVGLDVRETPIDTSFCAHAILEDDFLQIPDATQDPRFSCNPLVTGEPRLRFYAGALLRTEEGLPIGTVCVLDTKPRRLDDRQVRSLGRLARQAMSLLQLRLALRDRIRSEERLHFLDRLVEATQPLRDPTSIMAVTARMLGKRLNVAVCAYADMEPDQDGFTIRGDWTVPGAPSIVGTYSLAGFGARAVGELRAGRPLVTRDTLAELGPEQAALFLKLGLEATVCMPLVKEGRLTALMAVHSASPRDWSDDELALIADTTERSWAHIERTRSEAALQRRSGQLQDLAEVAAAVARAPSLEATLEEVTHAARRVIGVHQGVVSLTRGPDWRQAINTLALTEKYARWRDYATAPDGSGIYAWVCEGSHPIRFTQAELEAHPRWRGFGMHAAEHPTMRGWLAAPLLGRDGRNLGLIQLSDKQDGSDFDAADEAMLVQLAQLASAAIEQSQTEAALRESEARLETRVAERTAELVESEQRFRAIFDTTFQLTGLATLDGTLLVVNRAALEAVGSTQEQVSGTKIWDAPWWEATPNEARRVREGVERVAAGEFVRYETELVLPSGQRTFDFSMKPVLSEVGEPAFLVAEGRDITDLKRTEEALRQAQKLEAMGQLTGGVAHDFNNLLTIIRSSADLLRKPDLAEDRRRRYVDAIVETVGRASKLTAQLLAFARRQALKPEVFDPNERLRAVTDMLRTVVGSRIGIVTDFACGRCFVKADANQFETALVNMVVNARDAMDGEGRLTVRVTPEPEMPPIRGHGGARGRFVAVSLNDTGGGIPRERLSQVFEPFFTTKEVGKGTGLGLSQVYGFAKQSGGDVAVESEVGRGTTFTLYLPQVDEEAAEAPADARGGSVVEPGRGRRVLLVEDNVEVGSFSTQILRDLGYETTWAANAEEALGLLSATNGFDVVFSDVVMPGISGIELGMEIRRLHPGLPVVLTSGYSHVLAQEGRHGFELLHKPYAAEELSRVLQRVARG